MNWVLTIFVFISGCILIKIWLNRKKIIEWFNGTNHCPNCGKVNRLRYFGIYNRLCISCYEKEVGKWIASNGVYKVERWDI
jgi:hypothetical protein